MERSGERVQQHLNLNLCINTYDTCMINTCNCVPAVFIREMRKHHLTYNVNLLDLLHQATRLIRGTSRREQHPIMRAGTSNSLIKFQID